MLKERFEKLRQLSPEERRQLQEKLRDRGKLSPEEKRNLRQQLKEKLQQRQKAREQTVATALTQEQKITRFLNRTSLGATREETEKVARIGIPAYLEGQLYPERIPDALAEEKLKGLK